VGAHRLIAVGSAVLLSAGLSACSSGTRDIGTTSDLRSETATVAWVADGDTIGLRDTRRVRLVQIDAPEVGECFASDATRVLRALLPAGTRVGLGRDPRLDDRDAYGRLLRYVTNGSLEVNAALVARGAAVPYFFRGARGVHARELLAAVREARRRHRGLWGACPNAKLDPTRGSITGPS
jgi:endonuclease YncB( thermonuclease family)